MGLNLLSVISQKSITNDEIVHIPAGYHYLVGGDFRLNPEHPPLVKMWAALPLLFVHPHPSSLARPAGQDFADFTRNSSNEFWQLNRSDFERIVFWARLQMILLTLGLGWLIFIFGRDLFGDLAGLLAVAMFSVEPTMLAHGHIVQTDVPAALGYLLFIFACYRSIRKPTAKSAALLGVATGLVVLTKYTMLITVPTFFGVIIYLAWRGISAPSLYGRLRDFLLATVICILLINSAYYFQHPTLARAETDWINLQTPAASGQVLSAINGLSKIFPTYFLFGIYTVAVHNKVGHTASLLGRYSDFGWWYYFPVAFVFKTTIWFLLNSLCALGWALWRTRRGERVHLILLIPFVIYLALAMSSNINIGIRHIAPVFPLLFLLSGAFLSKLFQRMNYRIPVLLAGLILIGLMFVDAVRIHPDYLAFTSPLGGDKESWQLLSDSNVEWGEDVGDLARYLKAKGESEVTASLSGGATALELYGIRATAFAPRDLQHSSTRYVALGAGYLNGSTLPPEVGIGLPAEERHNYFSKYRALEPESTFGGSIFLYRRKD